MALLAKRFGVRPPGWKNAAGPFADRSPRTVADIDSPESLARVRQWKQAQKAANKDKQDRPLTVTFRRTDRRLPPISRVLDVPGSRRRAGTEHLGPVRQIAAVST